MVTMSNCNDDKETRVSEVERAKMSLMNPSLIAQKLEDRTIDEVAKPIIEVALKEGVETVWDRFEIQQPPCKYCASGVSCSRCAMGPCRIIHPVRERGVCGANADLIVARNLLDTIATGAAAHSDHGRDIVETLYKTAIGKSDGYIITDIDKMSRLAEEYGLDISGKPANDVARDLSLAMMDEFGMVKNSLQCAARAPPQTREIWKKCGITPRGIDREIVDSMHRIQMGVGASHVNMLLQGLRTSLGDGWGGSMLGTDVSDILFGTPQINMSSMNLGVLKKDYVNVSLHGHNPILSEMVVRAIEDPDIRKLVSEKGAKGVNLVGLCCTGNELQMRKGIPMAGNHFNQELVIATGALEAMVIDYQCIFPSLPRTASCYHTKVISTSEKSKVPGAIHMEIHPENAYSVAKDIVRLAVENYPNRNQNKVNIPGTPVSVMTGFSVEAIKKALGGTWKPLVDLIASGKIRGAVGIVGCNNPKIKHDYGHVNLSKELIRRDILCVETGCAAVASGKAGLLQPEAAELAGPGLKEVCQTLGIPPVLHMGSCVDCSRILVLLAELANTLNVGIHQLPVAGAAPEWYSQKAVSIGSYFVASGVFTVLGVMPKISGSTNTAKLLTSDLNDVVHAAFAVEPDPFRAADIISTHIEQKRSELGI
nr:hypothetical protein [uncultured bacterium]